VTTVTANKTTPLRSTPKTVSSVAKTTAPSSTQVKVTTTVNVSFTAHGKIMQTHKYDT